jgi:hypothetical protein
MDTTTIMSCATFLIGTILVGLGAIILTASGLLINNFIVKYWKPVQFFHYINDLGKDPFSNDTGKNK